MTAENKADTPLDLLKKRIAQLNAIAPKSLIRDDLGEYNFRVVLPDIESTLAFFRDLGELPLEKLPEKIVVHIKQKADEAIERFENVKGFKTLGLENPERERNNLSRPIATEYKGLFEKFHSYVAYLKSQLLDPQVFHQKAEDNILMLQESLASQIEQAKGVLKAGTDEVDKIKSEADDVLVSIRDTAGLAGVTQYSGHFDTSAKEASEASTRWFCGTILLSVITLGFAAYAIKSVWATSGEMSVQWSLQMAIAKAAFFSVLYSAILWASRNYRAQRHNYTVNKHRGNALNSFQAFVQASEEPEIRNAVLLYAAQSIFAPQTTGYLGKEPEPQGLSQFVEVFRKGIQKSEG